MAAAGVALPDEPGLPGADDPYPPSLTIGLEKVETLRYGENPHQPAARYRRAGATRRRRPVRDRRAAAPGQGALVQQRPRRLGRRGDRPRPARPGLRDRQAHQPVRRRGTRDAPRGVGGGARRRPGLGVRRRRGAHRRGRRRDRRTASRASSSRSSSRRRSRPAALEVLAAKPNLRLVEDPSIASRAARPGPARLDPVGRRRRPRHRARHRRRRPDDVAASRRRATRRTPSGATSTSPGGSSAAATSNAIVLVRDGALVGLGSGQTSRVDAARQAVEKACAIAGEARVRGRGLRLGRVLPVPGRRRGLPRGRRDARSSSPAARCATPR